MAHIGAPAAAPSSASPSRPGVVARVKDVLRPLEPYFPTFARGPSWGPALQVLQQHGFEPATVFDIGVGFGTWGLYRAFPNALYHLIEPTRESLPYMERLSRRLRCLIHNVALGDHEGEAMLEVRADIQGSTLLEEVGPRDTLRFDRVPLRRFDSLIRAFERPALCKIDVQGAELMVLEGMGERIGDIDVFIVETSTIATVKGGAEMADVVGFLSERGFAVADIVGLKRRPLDGATAQVDLLFVREDSPLRADRRWARAS
ncbi:MAG: FkbM family methyltransferase [Proteobacteria bacterium]|nr:FkbM family methyltransferase [Pseudomonadota bacterium]